MKRTVSFLLTLILLLGGLPGVCAASDEAFSVNAAAALLVDLDTGTVLYAQNADTRLYPASLTKIMTCMLALEQGNLTDVVTVTSTALDGLDPAGSSAGLKAGENLRLEDLLYCIMVASANDACNVVAEHLAGSIPAFVAQMNEKALALGCADTHFANPNGLHDPEHYTTANDLYKITAAALQNDTFRKICNTAVYTVPPTNKSSERPLATSNYLISTATNNAYYYPDAMGVKTGYTSQAGRCLVSTADNGQLHVLGVILGADTTVLESGDVVQESFREMANLFDYGFEHFVYTEILSSLQPIHEIPVTLSAGAEEVVLVPSKALYALLPTDFDRSACIYAVDLQGNTSLEAPVKEGQTLGTVTVSYQGRVLGQAPLVALYAVQRSDFAYYTRALRQFFSRWWPLVVILVVVLLIAVYLTRNAAARRRRKERHHDER